MKFFRYDNVNGDVILEDESLFLIRELESLLDPKRNITKTDKTGKNKTRAFKEFKYIYLFFDWGSPYFAFAEQDKHKESLLDSGLTDQEFDDPVFREACRKYNDLQNSSLEIRLLKGAMLAIENQIHYLEHIDLQERDPVTGKPIFKSKDLIAEIKGCKDIITALRELEYQVKKGEATNENLRGDVEAGMFD